jgi:hypothetical protein
MPDGIGVPKIHPATRAVEPEDPLSLFGYEIEGDPELMLRMLVEEYARMGYDCDALMELARNPFYQAVYGLRQLLGEEELRCRVSRILARCGVLRTSWREALPAPDVVQLQLPANPLPAK